jgi:hypothetical protein
MVLRRKGRGKVVHEDIIEICMRYLIQGQIMP